MTVAAQRKHPSTGMLAALAITSLFSCAVFAQGATFTTIKRGLYLVRAGDCAACHTAEGGKPFAGGRPVPTPFGTIYSTNITPDKETGIGGWTQEQFYQAMHEGIGPGGKHYYPAFPYPWYTRVSEEDIRAIKSFLDALPPERVRNVPPELPWPLSEREVMSGWNGLFFQEGTFRGNIAKSAQWNRGAYLVEGLGHCGGCHTPKNALGASKKNQRFAGGFGEHWYAMSLTSDMRDGLGAWSTQEIIEYLKTGSNAKAAAAGPMAEVVENSTQHLSESDLQAIAVYLKEIPAAEDSDAASAKDNDSAAMTRGKALYLDNCTGCHMEGGEGVADVFPPLKASAPVQSKEPATVLKALIDGATVAATKEKPTALAMPAFGWKFSDAEVADIATYIRNAWGNRASAVSASDSAKVRRESLQAAAK